MTDAVGETDAGLEADDEEEADFGDGQPAADGAGDCTLAPRMAR